MVIVQSTRLTATTTAAAALSLLLLCFVIVPPTDAAGEAAAYGKLLRNGNTTTTRTFQHQVGGFLRSSSTNPPPPPRATADGGDDDDGSRNGGGQEPPFRSGEIVIKGHPNAAVLRGGQSGSLHVKTYYEMADLSVLAVPDGEEQAYIAKLRQEGIDAELNYVMTPSFTPKDTHFEFQWNMKAIQAEQAWDVTKGKDVIVAVVDTGLREGGVEDGIECVVEKRNAVNGNADVNDTHGHGTFLAGTIGQKTDNEKGVAGLAHEACIMPIKVFAGASETTDTASVASGLAWAIDKNADVILLSLSATGGVIQNNFLNDQLSNARNEGITVVASSGNDGADAVGYPASNQNVIAVGATDVNNRRAMYSNYGDNLDLVAPGGDILWDRNNDGYPDGILQETITFKDVVKYDFRQGTSIAAAHVAAAAALIVANSKAKGEDVPTPDGIKTALTSTAKPDSACPPNECGVGLLQVNDALKEDLPGGGSNVEPVPEGYSFFVSRAGRDDEGQQGVRWCMTARDGVGDDETMGLLQCDFEKKPPEQLFQLLDSKIITNMNADQCLVVHNGRSIHGGARIKFLPCNAEVTYNTFKYDPSTEQIQVSEDDNFCLTMTGNSPHDTDTIRTELCVEDDPLFQFELSGGGPPLELVAGGGN